MLPNVSSVLMSWETPTTIRTVTRTTTNFVESLTTSDRTQLCVVQVADKTKLDASIVDWSLAYLTVHSRDALALGEYVPKGSAWYKVIAVAPWGDYGYIEAVCEEARMGVR